MVYISDLLEPDREVRHIRRQAGRCRTLGELIS
jgi:hypothetical protein